MAMKVDTKEIGRRFFEEMIAQARWAVAEEILAPDVVMHHPSRPAPMAGRAEVVGFLQAFRAGFPDLQMKAEDIIAEGDRLAVRWQMRGTHTADLLGIPPTGKAVGVAGISFLRLAGDKVVEDWVTEDSLGLMRQLGVIPG